MVYDDRVGPVLLHGEIIGMSRIEVPPDARDLAGEFPYRRPVEVRFGDTDAMGHVNNAVYLTYVELARAGYYRAVTGGRIGIGATEREQSFILAEARLGFRQPAFFGEILWVEARTAVIGRSSFTMEFRMTAEESPYGRARLVATGATVQVGFDYDAGHAEPLREGIVEALERFECRSLRG